MTKPSSLYDFECTDVRGQPLSLKQFTGQPLVIVNTASLCGYSTQFKGLEDIWQNYKDKGLVVIGVPSNDFGHQEPGSSTEIVKLCSAKFGITFPLLAKTSVIGKQAHPLFKQLAHEGGFMARPRWNFYKYIVGRNGHLQDWFSSFTAPGKKSFEKAVAKAIG